MTPAARVQAAIELLDLIITAVRENGAAADTIIAGWFRERRYAGSKDRRAVRDLVFRAIRTFGVVPPSGRAAFISFPDLHPLFGGSQYGPAAIGADETPLEPGFAAAWLSAVIPDAERIALLERAPLDLRVNVGRATTEEVQGQLPGAERIAFTPHGLRLPDNIPLANRPDLQGLVEVQDAGSQLIAVAAAAKPGMTVLDLCAGAGGKTLALAADMQNTGRLIASDTNRSRLQELPLRAQRADVSNIETILLNPGKERAGLADLAGKCDVVLVDAPCSGTGTWRRNPELRWRLTPGRLQQTVDLQVRLLDIAAEMVAPGGHLVYAVCSVLAAEGRGQLQQFLNSHAGWMACDTALSAGRAEGDGVILTPAHDGTDGFFLARLQKL